MSSIEVVNVSLKFRLYHDKTPSLKDYLAQFFRSKSHSKFTDFWALKNVSLTIRRGDRVGIVGHNGAGKSTLLKTICRIYSAQSGDVKITGRVAPLIEIGAGFNPEFSGRDNIYFSGSILGYSKDELRRLEGEIIEFTELEEFIDTPVKYYSTGMYMKLAFAIATAVHPEILILDEVFAGGDASFIAKAKQRMTEFIDKASIMVCVSHDMDLLRTLCNRVVWLDHGQVKADGNPDEIITQYLAAR
ncbi:ABC transporter ATP-binding protein [Burkholderia aenigmatica]|uniref:ABC transporter ATP-binding protein n=1 Tax=Burkholderia aenigmatica TaxID=2015348 RepID=A0A6J5JET4_9BURK|nr:MULTISPECIES: ABC transporter ATP-binding protein [Burkholderia]AYQ37520.1 ABC transporter [Burkholderia lata]MCA8296527.1 ABC transporter ATP-binding protein [Burkholderia sp. AU30198]WGY69195.1 ABC transporter ATP-binding protein [Burkholderia cepacia]CAB3970159.1 ABC transporter ATP-binding protein [Burkholderia aenigmatica]VWC62127.1 ABC transporter ATP-binding protein [Burkholderia aenigmatica]